jgi:glycosyltransferase involved in cell wall biosynthesis
LTKKIIYYWSPFLTNIATSKAVINSAYSVKKFLKDCEPSIIDAAGEFESKKQEIKEKNVSLIKLNFFNYINLLPKFGRIGSRLSFSIIFILSFFSLKKIIEKNKPDFLIIHLITSLPLLLFKIYNFNNTKLILRISGYPKMGKIRIFFWRFFLKNIFLVTCPTEATYKYLLKINIVSNAKLKILYDPVLCISETSKKLKKEQDQKTNDIINDIYIVAVGRLTKQKNFIFLINNFLKIYNISPNIKLLILGAGEQYGILEKRINELNLNNKIKLLGNVDNIFPYLKKSRCFCLASLWEDPGFVILEAAFARTFVISSNCKNGPEEILEKNRAGLLFKKNDSDSFVNTYDQFMKLSKLEKLKYKKNALLVCKKFTIFNHAKNLKKILL